jgi:hypothetical protein
VAAPHGWKRAMRRAPSVTDLGMGNPATAESKRFDVVVIGGGQAGLAMDTTWPVAAFAL